jgi:hypothetical protein
MRRARRWAVPAAVIVTATAVGDTTTKQTFDVVAETGQRPPGTAAGVTYTEVQTPTTDGTGAFFYEAQLFGAGSAVFYGKRGAVQLVAAVNAVAPGAGGLAWNKLLGVGQIVRPSGKLAFMGELANADPSQKGGVWTGVAGNLELLVREGDPAPGAPAGVVFAAGAQYFQGGLHLAMNDAGTVALRATLTGTGVTNANDTAIFAGAPGALALVGRLGSAAPDAGGASFTRSDVTHAYEVFSPPSMNASGKICFRGHLAGAGVTSTNADAIWFGDPADPKIVVRGGQTVTGPNLPSGAYLIGPVDDPPVINDAGQILFKSSFQDGVNQVQTVWLGTPDAPAAIAMRGQSVPGDSQGSTLGGSILHLRLNGAGQAAFHQTLSSGASDWAAFMWDGSALHEVWRKGDPAPGMPAGETFNGSATEDLFINAQGKVLFRTTTTPSSILGVWLWDPRTGTSQLVARTGADALVGATTRQFKDLLLFSGPDTAGSTQDGRSSPLGDDGTYAIFGETTDQRKHTALLTNRGVPVSAGTTTTSLSVGTTMDVTGSGFGGGASKFHPPTAWLTVGDDPRKIPLKVDGKTASDTEIHATLASLRKGAHGAATLHVLPRVKHATEATISVTIELPSLANLSATDLHGGDVLTVSGAYFGSKKKIVQFKATVNGKLHAWKFAVKTWADGSITALVPKRVVPKGSTTLVGEIVVTNDAGDSETIAFTVDA